MKRIGYTFLIVFSLLLLVACKPEEKNTYYTVTFDSNGGKNIESAEVLKGEKVQIPTEPTREGFTFEYWSLDGEKFDFNTSITKDTTLTAKWEEVIPEPEEVYYEVEFDTLGDSSIDTIEVLEGTKVDKPSDPTKEGYKFIHWLLDGKEFDFNTSITKDTTLTAKWEEIIPEPEEVYYEVEFDTLGGSSIDTIEVLEGTKVDKPSDPTKDGYTFEYWLLDAEEFDFNTSIDRDTTLTAKWEENKEYVSQRLLLIDFGNSGVPGYDSSSFTFTNESDGNSYTFNKTRAQLNKGNSSYHDGMGVGLVMSPVSGKEVSNIEIDLSNLEGLHKIEFKIASWHNSSFNKISGFNNATLNVYKKDGSDFILMKDLNEKPALANLTKETYTSVSYELDGAGIYKIEYNAPSAASGNTTQALMVDDIGIFSLVEAGDNNLVTFDYNYEGSPSHKIVMVETGSTIDDYEPERLGYDFLGWYFNDEEYDFNSKVESNFTLKAKWEQSAIVVTFDYGYLDKEAYIELVNIGENVYSPIEPQREGYNFLGWIETDIGKDIHDNQVFPFKPTNNIRFIANWDIIDKEPSDLNRDDNNFDDLYSSLEGKTGEELYNGLKDIITNEHDPVNYGDARYALEEADRHPHDDGMVLGIYDRSILYGPWNHPIWEREHVWPNSKLGVARADNPTVNQASDLHNLRAIVPTVNQRRGNRYFVNTTFNSPLGHVVGEGTYYPGDEDIGDVARIFLYMVIRYDDLKLTNDPTLLRLGDSSGYTNNTPETAYMGKLEVLYDWHLLDPVDDFEVRRNGVIEEWQGNRNPFIDHPELFKEVWEYLNTLDLNRLENLNSIEIIIDNEYVVKVDITFFKQRKNELVS